MSTDSGSDAHLCGSGRVALGEVEFGVCGRGRHDNDDDLDIVEIGEIGDSVNSIVRGGADGEIEDVDNGEIGDSVSSTARGSDEDDGTGGSGLRHRVGEVEEEGYVVWIL